MYWYTINHDWTITITCHNHYFTYTLLHNLAVWNYRQICKTHISASDLIQWSAISPHGIVSSGGSIQFPKCNLQSTGHGSLCLGAGQSLTISFSPPRYHLWFPITRNGSLFSHQSCLAVRCEFEGGWFINKRAHRFWITVMFCAAQTLIIERPTTHTISIFIYRSLLKCNPPTGFVMWQQDNKRHTVSPFLFALDGHKDNIDFGVEENVSRLYSYTIYQFHSQHVTSVLRLLTMLYLKYISCNW